MPRIVFIARDPTLPSSGGGGGGNRKPGPMRHGQAIGPDPLTLRVARRLAADFDRLADDHAPAPSVVLDARPLASGDTNQIGLPEGGISNGESTGPGSGGGVGEGAGTGIGPGRGPGVGPGSGGGIGGGVYRPGGGVTPPRVLTQVKPTYTNDAMLEKIQGTVVLELIVDSTGRPSNIRIVRSLDPGGLDQQAVIAASQWKFEPGRLAGRPVDVLVTLWLDFRLR